MVGSALAAAFMLLILYICVNAIGIEFCSLCVLYQYYVYVVVVVSSGAQTETDSSRL